MHKRDKKIGLFWIMMAMQLLFFFIVITITYLSFFLLIKSEAVEMTGNELSKRNTLLQLTLKEAFKPNLGTLDNALRPPDLPVRAESDAPPARPLEQQMVIEEMEDRIRQTSRLTNIRFTVLSPAGDVSFDSIYDREDLENQRHQPEILSLLAGEAGLALRKDEMTGADSIFQVTPLYGEGELIGFTRISQPFQITEELHKRIMMKMRFGNVLALVIISIILFPFIRSFIGKVDRIGDAARNIAHSRFDTSLPSSGIREFSALLNDMDTMSRQIKQQFRIIREQNEKLEEQSLFDELTGLGNRRKFNKTLEYSWWLCQREKHPVSFLILDIDHFKYYNDSLGHPAGDECLRQMGKILTGAVSRHTDVLVRLGGEEFGVLLPETEAPQAEMLGCKLLEAVRKSDIPHPASPVASHVTVSIGAATLVPSPELAMESLMERADRALYRAKENGRNRMEIDKS